MATAVVDVTYLSSYLSVPKSTLVTLVDEPTKELVNAVLQAVSARAREHDEVNDSKLRLGVELENAVRTGDSRTRGLKASVEKGLNELAELRGKLKEEENARSALETELQNAKSSSSISASEVQTLRSRVSTLESSNRDTVSLLESKCTSYDRLSQELSTQQQKSIDFRREITELEQSVQTAQSAATRAKFKEENYQSEIERLTNSNDFLSTELKTKTAEYLKYRKEKSARIAELERVKEEAESSSQSHQRMEESLRARLQELTQKYDDSIAKIQGYEDQAVNAEQSFRTELASISRLADLWEESAKSAKERIKELETALEELREGESELIGRLRAEADTERTEKESAEQRISELEDQVERLEADILALQHAPSLPGTPRRGINGASTPQLHRESSEVFSPSSSTRTKGNLNFTQLYAEYSTAKAELVAERRRNEKLSATMDDMVQDLESKGPEIQEMKAENERLQSEVMEISSMLEDSHKNRDRAKKEARKWEGEVEGFKKEGDLLRQQLRDLSIQVKILLSEIHIRDEGLDELSIEQRSQLENIARGSIDEDDETTDTDRFISQHLTTFKSIRELQEQNANLLKITRELGQKMENEEALMKKSQLAEEKEELERLRTRVEKYKDEIKTMMTTSQSYIKERDMFRRMLQHRGQLPSDADLGSLFGQSVPPATPSRGGLVPTVEHSPNTKEAAENASLLRELQAHFDSFREEAATDRRTLKDQTERLSRERGELQAQLARVNSQLTLATERFEMLQANYDMLKNENAELQKRSQILSESAAKQDVRTQQVAEDLVEAKSMIESMRTEAANLKAEKTLFKSIEQRMSQDNESLRNERARLNTLIANLENLQNQRELSETEMRNRLESQRQTLESELQTTRRKLEAEVEEGKKAALRKEYDSQQNQKRIDDLVATLGTIREELVATKTMKDHLQARVDELAIELKSAEEKVQALHPRPTLRSNANVNTEAGENDVDEDALSREQELTIEISELKRDLELATAQVEALKVDVGNYKDISQAAEDGLQSINETHDQYREETDRVIEEKDSKIRDLEQRVEEITSELTNTNAELSAVRAEAAEKARRTEEDKSSLGAEIARLKDEGERYIMTAQFHQEDLRTQATIAQEAQVNYERELVKHADAAKALQKIRGDYNELKTRDMGLQIEAEAAKAALAQSQDNWDDMQKNFEKELSEMRARRDDLISQNKLLHQQLEAFGSQVAALQQNRASHVDAEGEGTPGGTPSGTDNSVDDFREIIRYLRREKEIVDVQYELSIQESKRLKKQLDHTQSQLDETRLKLEQERRSQADIGRSSAAHKDLMEKLNELNLIRESSVTLRNEARVTRGQLEEKSRKVEELLTQIQPLESRVRELENQLEIKNGEMKLLQEDRDRWQQRNQQILQKYDRIDPAEMESLKERIAALQKERDELSTEKQGFAALKEQVDTIHEQIRIAQEEAIAPWRQRQEKLIEQTKERLRNIRSQLTEKVTEYEAVVKEKENLELQLSATRQELEAVKSRRDEAHADAISSQPLRQAPAPEAVTHNGFEEGQVAEDHQQYAKLSEQERKIFEEKIALAEAEAREKEEKVRRLQDVSVTHEQKIEGLNREVTEVRGRLEIANSQLAQLEKSRQNVEATSQMDTESTEAVEKLRRDLSAAQREVEALKTEAAIQQTIGNVSMDENSKPLAEQISDRVDAIKSDLETKHNERIQDLEGTYIRRTEHMKNQLNKKLHESRAQNSLEIEKLRAEHQQETNDLNAQHQKEVERLNNRLQEEIERVKKEESRFEEQKRAISTQQPQTVASTEAGHPANIKSEALDVQIQPQDWSPTQVKDFIASNATAKDILQRNVQSKLARERETLVARIKEEESKLTEAKLEEAQRSVEAIKERLEEAQKNIEAVKEKAVAMESQKSKVKISMAENRAKQAQAKIEVVEKAATEEPQKPVVEVWAIAKLAKPPSLLPPQGDAQTGSFGRPQQPQGQQAPQTSVFGKPTLPLTQTPDPAAEGSEQAQQQKQPTSMQFPQNPPSSSLPSKPPPSQQNAGTGPGALRSILGAGQSAIPRGGGGVGRGQQGRRGSSQQNQGQNQNQNQSQPPQSFQQPQQLFQAQQFHPGQNLNQRGGNQTNLPRGGGNRGGRGGRGGSSQNVNTGTGGMRNNSPGNSPGSARGGLNAGARQFVPQGNKRPRDDGPDNSNDGGNIGKRVRGAAGGGA